MPSIKYSLFLSILNSQQCLVSMENVSQKKRWIDKQRENENVPALGLRSIHELRTIYNLSLALVLQCIPRCVGLYPQALLQHPNADQMHLHILG